MMSKKFINRDLKSSLVSEFIMHMAKGIILLLQFFPKKSPNPHFLLFPGSNSWYYFMRLYVISKDTNCPNF